MKFRTHVEPPEPMRGLEVPPEVVEALAGGKRPPVIITINGHSWRSRVASMRGRFLLGLSNANRQAAGVATGDEIEVDVELDAEPRVVVEPADFARALDADPIARTAYDRLPDGRKREHVRAIASAKKPETRIRRVEKGLGALRDVGVAGERRGAREDQELMTDGRWVANPRPKLPIEEISMGISKDKQKSAKSTTASGKKSKGFTDEERAAVRARAKELKAEERANKNRA